MAGGAVSCWIALSRNDESSRVRTPVEEELRHNIERKHCPLVQVFIVESKNAEYHCQENEAKYLQWLPPNCINGQDRSPIAGERAGDSKYYCADCVVVKLFV